ncbi:type VI secretion system baseplate subunit TssG [Massilia sp. Leaf139]|uniref:type VI secretion system baseplate subunit TssG n=1 Tax=Massilia sp. Leaf139 TaxID=1736272 RepID=UPI0006F5E4E1|nr:type VI secretion system baseplate subunit TssG [Massilia sp. Leaf139]KQQ88647.1 type VI secretion protein [Massilia sp. Leaf139]
MPTQKRRFEPAVIERLFREPYRFEYFQAVRMLELWLRKHGAPGGGLVANFLRFQNSTLLRFPASQLEAIGVEPRTIEPSATSLGAALQASTLQWIRITPTFMGLLGGHGVLPPHYTERVAEQQSLDKDEGARAFLDTFSNRSLALFYEAWRKYRLHLKYESTGRDGFLPLLLGLAGLGNPALRRRLGQPEQGAVLDESLGYFAAALRQRPVSAVQMGRVLSEYFSQPIRVDQFMGAWYAVPPAQQSTLGCDSATLGTRAIAGERVWQRDLRLRLVIGPLDRAGFDAFLPGGLAARALNSLAMLFTGLALEYEVELVLRAADVCCATLSGDRHAGRLGWGTYLVAGPQREDRRDVHYDLRME